MVANILMMWKSRTFRQDRLDAVESDSNCCLLLNGITYTALLYLVIGCMGNERLVGCGGMVVLEGINFQLQTVDVALDLVEKSL
jgi:hypothetical protein